MKENNKKYIIAGFAGIGKTTLDKLNSKDVIDMEIRPYKYVNYKNEYTLKQWYTMEHILNENFLPRYIDAVKEEIKNGTHKIIFVWLTIEVLKFLDEENIEYIVATWNDKEEGMKSFLDNLYTERGNPIHWRQKVLNYLPVINNYAKENNIEMIILNKGENIQEKLKELEWLD